MDNESFKKFIKHRKIRDIIIGWIAGLVISILYVVFIPLGFYLPFNAAEIALIICIILLFLIVVFCFVDCILLDRHGKDKMLKKQIKLMDKQKSNGDVLSEKNNLDSLVERKETLEKEIGE